MHIPFRQAMRATCYGDANGPKGDIFKLKEALDNATTARNIEDSKQADGYNGAKKAKDLQGASLSDLVSAVNKEAAARNTQAEQNLADHIIEAVEAGIWMPVEIVIARPFIEHLMLSAVVAVAGRDTGATLFGPAGKRLHPILALSLLLRAHTHTFATCFHAFALLWAPGRGLQDKDLWSSYLAAHGHARNARLSDRSRLWANDQRSSCATPYSRHAHRARTS